MPLARPEQPIRLHAARLSGHAHRAKLCLSLLGLPFETVEVNLAAGEQRQPAFLAMSPFGHVPVIEDGDTAIFDSNAILVYLAKRYGDASWLPDDPVGAAHVAQWLSLAAGQIAYGPCAARLIKLFGYPLDYASAVRISNALFAVIDPQFEARPSARTRRSPTSRPIRTSRTRPKAAFRWSRIRTFAHGSPESKHCRASSRCPSPRCPPPPHNVLSKRIRAP